MLVERNLLLPSVSHAGNVEVHKQNIVDEDPTKYKYDTNEEFNRYKEIYDKLIDERDALCDQLKRLITPAQGMTDESSIQKAFERLTSNT